VRRRNGSGEKARDMSGICACLVQLNRSSWTSLVEHARDMCLFSLVEHVRDMRMFSLVEQVILD
jgi:hypothetical protein